MTSKEPFSKLERTSLPKEPDAICWMRRSPSCEPRKSDSGTPSVNNFGPQLLTEGVPESDFRGSQLGDLRIQQIASGSFGSDVRSNFEKGSLEVISHEGY